MPNQHLILTAEHGAVAEYKSSSIESTVATRQKGLVRQRNTRSQIRVGRALRSGVQSGVVPRFSPPRQRTLLHARKGVSAACAQHQPCAKQAVMVVSTLSEALSPSCFADIGSSARSACIVSILTLMRKSIHSGVVLLISWCPLHAESSCVV